MNNFKSGGFRSGGQKFGGGKKFGGDKKFGGGQNRGGNSGGSPAKLFSATCSECGKQCDVPFKPSQDKPVYCSACFGMKKSANEPRGYENGNNRSERGSFNNDRQDYTKPPREQRPPRHDATRGRSDDGIAELKRQISGLETKLNKILDLINPPMPAKKAALPVVEKVEEVEKKVELKTPPKAVAKKAVKKTAAKTTTKKVAVKKTAKAPAKKVTKKVAKAASKKAVKKTPK